ncbi:hypothetical protein SAMN05444166_0127 [Singulisphaera sp. GP187]|nr:hypothetical protein SAMN05444166_0127 [Singulisphaera sp. GP187]
MAGPPRTFRVAGGKEFDSESITKLVRPLRLTSSEFWRNQVGSSIITL